MQFLLGLYEKYPGQGAMTSQKRNCLSMLQVIAMVWPGYCYGVGWVLLVWGTRTLRMILFLEDREEGEGSRG